MNLHSKFLPRPTRQLLSGDTIFSNGGYGSGRYDHRHSVLPIGKVDLHSHDNEMFGKVWNGWEEGKGSNISTKDGKGTVRIIHTSENPDSAKNSYTANSEIPMKHDQTFRTISDDAKVTGVFPHNTEGMKQLSTHLGKKSANFYTFK